MTDEQKNDCVQINLIDQFAFEKNEQPNESVCVNNDKNNSRPITTTDKRLGDQPTKLENNVELTQQNTVRRNIPECPGVYLQGILQGVKTWFTVDTGASKTIVSKKVYDQIKHDKPPLTLTNRAQIKQAGGQPLSEHGHVTLTFDFKSTQFDKDVIVADIQDEVLIGMDIGDPLDVIASQKQGGHWW